MSATGNKAGDVADTVILYGFGPNDRSGKVRWVAHELGLPIEERRLRPGEHRAEPYKLLNPYGMVPTVLWRGMPHIESNATITYLAEVIAAERGGSSLVVGPAEPGRPSFLQWCALFAETFESRLVEYYLSRAGMLPAQVAELTEARLRERLETLTLDLPKEGFLVAGRFTVADVIAAYSLRLAIRSELIERQAVWGYLGPLTERPAAERAGFFASLVAS